MLWRRVSRELLAVVDVVGTTQRSGGKAKGAARVIHPYSALNIYFTPL
jgi:hypothetical protein